jgi:hypothetical protein
VGTRRPEGGEEKANDHGAGRSRPADRVSRQQAQKHFRRRRHIEDVYMTTINAIQIIYLSIGVLYILLALYH